MSAPLIIPEDRTSEVALQEKRQAPADAGADLRPSPYRLSGVLGLGFILLIVFVALYCALRYLM